jgi:B9 domain-containing protein 2
MLQGWPRLLFEIWRQDAFGRLDLEGYGFCHVPTAAGIHELSCPTWRPVGTPAQEFASYFLGGHPGLKSTSTLYTAASERFRLVTTGTGTVHVRLEVVFRHMEQYGVEW